MKIDHQCYWDHDNRSTLIRLGPLITRTRTCPQVAIIIIIIIIITKTIFMVTVIMAEPLREFTRFI